MAHRLRGGEISCFQHFVVIFVTQNEIKGGYEPLDGTGTLKSSNMYSAIFVFMFSTRCDAVTHNAVDTTVHNTTSSSYIPHDYIYANK